ncbi:hypothetical protein HMPREF0321_1594 [Dermacoccus sp. Ellin185]|nr:hypothetical protein HMPREF0321_1594 [Dermacoccus sp. Ellin185]
MHGWCSPHCVRCGCRPSTIQPRGEDGRLVGPTAATKKETHSPNRAHATNLGVTRPTPPPARRRRPASGRRRAAASFLAGGASLPRAHPTTG